MLQPHALPSPRKCMYLILTFVLFIVATFLTLKEEAIVYGFNEYGFPFRLYTFSKCKEIANVEQTGFDLIGFTLDIFITATLGFVTIKAFNKFYKPKDKIKYE